MAASVFSSEEKVTMFLWRSYGHRKETLDREKCWSLGKEQGPAEEAEEPAEGWRGGHGHGAMEARNRAVPEGAVASWVEGFQEAEEVQTETCSPGLATGRV